MTHAIRFALAALLTSVLVVGVAPVVAQEAEEPSYVFASMPDFLNADVGDIRQRPRWTPGHPNSINASYREAMNTVLDSVKTEAPESVLVAGDLVGDHWGKDKDGTKIFGRTNTFRRRLRAVGRAGNLYFSQWLDRFEQRGLPVYPAVGDHDIGDDRWRAGTFKYRAVPRYKSVWARHFTDSGALYDSRPVGTAWEDTAYATYLTPDLLLVTVDVFKRSTDEVHAMVTNGQLEWLDAVLADNAAREDGAKWVIVQGHTPVLGPVRISHSSGLYTEEPEAFWETLRRHDVTAYFDGEVHTVTMRHDGVTQISHGNGLQALYGSFNYLIGKVYDDRIEITIKRLPRAYIDTSDTLWSTHYGGPAIGIGYEREAQVTGTAVLTTDDGRIGESTGELIPVEGEILDE